MRGSTANQGAIPKQSEIIFGYTSALRPRAPPGFVPGIDPTRVADHVLIADASDSHVLLIGPTGSGKGRSMLIPNLLHWKSSVIVVDIKGELAHTTARYRAERLGHKVPILDPFQSVGSDNPDALNPIDWLNMRPEHLADNSLMLAHVLTGEERGHKEPFWDLLADDFVASLIAFAATHPDPSRRNLHAVWELLTGDDTAYSIAITLDKNPDLNPFVRTGFANFLQHEGEKVRSSVLSTARQHMRIFASPMLQRSVTDSTFSLKALRDGEPMSIYLVLEPQKVHSHSAILRLWLSVLLGVLMERRCIPEHPTLLMVDELPQLGALPMLFQAITLMRGFGLRCLLTVQSLAQLKSLWPTSYETLVENCGIVQALGPVRWSRAPQLADMLGDLPEDVLPQLSRDRALLTQNALAPTSIGKLDYLLDPIFRGRFQVNPYYAMRTIPRTTPSRGSQK